ncbi:hypothetical protein ENBRE01_0937 [Enteropsectra breve]|nr:hypothetical protein ENBRE01_0937 [Enteropsectra breve]
MFEGNEDKKDKRDKKKKNSFMNVGEDDAYPNFDQNITKKTKQKKGSIFTPEYLDPRKGGQGPEGSPESGSDTENPLEKFDPIFPDKKNPRKGNDPDPDHLDPGKNNSSF